MGLTEIPNCTTRDPSFAVKQWLKQGNSNIDIIDSSGIGSLFAALVRHDTQLECFSIKDPYLDTNVSIKQSSASSVPTLWQFLVSQKSLKDLSLIGCGTPMSTILECTQKNSKTLRKVVLNHNHRILSLQSGPRITFSSPVEMKRFRDNCPELEYFDIYMPVGDLQIVSSSPPCWFAIYIYQKAMINIRSHRQKLSANSAVSHELNYSHYLVWMHCGAAHSFRIPFSHSKIGKQISIIKFWKGDWRKGLMQ